MPSNSFQYEAFGTNDLVLPKRSECYSMEPIGLGTPFVESLTSYICRVAEAHRVYTGQFARSLIMPRINYTASYTHQRADIFLDNASAIDGTGKVAKYTIDALEAITLRNDIKFLTFVTWSEVIVPINFLRKHRAWCPECFEEWNKNGQVIYEPLIWRLNFIKICPKHKVPLNQNCHKCSSINSVISYYSRPGQCTRCLEWLGCNISDLTPLLEESQEFIISQVSELLSYAPKTDNQLPTRLKLQTNIGKIIEIYSDFLYGNDKNLSKRRLILDFAKFIKRHEGMVNTWCTDRIPTFENLIIICQKTGVHLINLFSELNEMEFNFSSIESMTRTSKIRIHFEKELAEEELIKALNEEPPIPLSVVCKKLNCNHVTINYHFPELSKRVVERYRKYRRDNKELNLEKGCNEVREATLKLHQMGVFPSFYRIADLITQKGILMRKEAQQVRNETLRELSLI